MPCCFSQHKVLNYKKYVITNAVFSAVKSAASLSAVQRSVIPLDFPPYVILSLLCALGSGAQCIELHL